MDIRTSSWITVSRDPGDACPVFRRQFAAEKAVEKAELQITALGVYLAEINGRRVGDFVLAPGWTSYDHRLQVQSYDVTGLLQKENSLCVTVGRGWFRSPMPGWVDTEDKKRRAGRPCGLIAFLHIVYTDGTEDRIATDEAWQWAKSRILFSEIYDGETCDARVEPAGWQPVKPLAWSKDILIPQEGEAIRETERIAAKRIFRTPGGDTVVDFGQEVTGYAEITLDARAGDEVLFDHAEVQDRDGNWYNENYRSAKARAKYICREGHQTWRPQLTFFGFRYIRLLAWPGDPAPENFTAVAVHSGLRRTGWLESGNPELNRLFSNIVWGQRGNFLDVPTDCPQRDERLGWTGDAQVFIKTASFLFDTERFFRKWLHDLAADQRASGEVGQVIPDVMPEAPGSAAWGDAAAICPWQVYQTYGDLSVLEDQFESMRRWVDFIGSVTGTPRLWTGHFHFGDWLGLDAPAGSYKGSSREDFIASAFYAHSAELVVKAGKLLGKDVSAYEKLHREIVSAFRKAFPEYKTQTEHVLAVHFGLAEDPQSTADALAEMVEADGVQLRTGFVGTPYILHVLSGYGHADLAWSLVLRREYPGWLYPVSRGATTVWEHWDGIREDGSFWSKDMNSFNHYAYGAVADWIFEQAAGIRHAEDKPGFEELIYAPHPDVRPGWLRARLDTRRGTVSALWVCSEDGIRYELETPVRAKVCLGGKETWVAPGKYTFSETGEQFSLSRRDRQDAASPLCPARSIKLNRDWQFGPGALDNGDRIKGNFGNRTVSLPHDYMIESDVFADAPSGAASGYYSAGVAHYVKMADIPAEWEGQRIALRLDGAMMNATVEVNGSLACLQHYGYAPFEADITQLVYPGGKNRITVTVNPSMQPNSRWYSGAGLFRGAELVHMPKLHIAFGGLSGSTKKIEYAPDGTPETAFLQVAAEIANEYAENRMAEVTFTLVDDRTGEAVKTARTLTQVQAMASGTAYMTLTVDRPALWSAETPNLYRLQARVKDAGTYKTHMVPPGKPAEDSESVLFGIRTVEADVKHGLRINGKEVKLRGGCLHHDNGPIGAVSLYDAEARKVRKLREVGFNAIRTTHNPPSAALIEACDRLGMYVFDEAFDAWGMGKQPGDYNQYFATDWEKDLVSFVKRDRCHPCVILWSTGNEITERAGLNDGYRWAVRLAETIRKADPSRPVSNAICSFWNGLDDDLQAEQMRRWQESPAAGLQNADTGGKKDLLWEQYTEAFSNGLDIVGYNYLEGKYEQDHEMFPERVMLGSENYPVEIGMHWPMIEKTPWIIGDFTWTAWDYIGEAGIGKATFYEPGDPNIGNPWGAPSPFPWRTANDADYDITGRLRPQGVYRRIVWGSRETGLFSYDPAVIGKVETLSSWGFPGVWPRWNWREYEGRPVDIAVFSGAEEAELFVNGVSVGRKKAGEALIHNMPLTFLFRAEYQSGALEAISYTAGKEVSRARLVTAGKPAAIRLSAETEAMKADGESLCYVNAELVDENGIIVPDADTLLKAEVTGAAELLGFGSGNPVTDENYTRGHFTSYGGRALAVLRAGCEAGEAKLAVSAEGAGRAEILLQVK